MSVVYEAVLLEGDLPTVHACFGKIRVPHSLRLYQAADRGFVVEC
jgi:hypothetical protein